MRKTHKEKKKLISSWQASGLAMTQWCKNQHIPVSTFSGWKAQLEKIDPVQLKEQAFISIDNDSNDVGLLGTMSKLDPRIILEGDQLFQEFNGALAENFVAIELHDKHFDELYYWTSRWIAEVDFVISTEHHIFPLEVKAGFPKKKKSLIVYDEKFSKEENAPLVPSKASLRNFALDGKLVNYPLYAISLFPRFRLKITE